MKLEKIFYSKCPNCHKYGIEWHTYKGEVTVTCKYCHEEFKTNAAALPFYVTLFVILSAPWIAVFKNIKPFIYVWAIIAALIYYLIGKFSPVYGKTTEYKYDNRYRCPWCGNKLPDFLDKNTCPECNHKIKIFSHSKAYVGILIAFISTLVILLKLKLFLPFFIAFEIGTLLLVAIYKLSIPYRVNDDIHILKQNAKIQLYNNKQSDILIPKLVIKKNRIFTICFVDDGGIPMSQMICVFLEDIKIDNRYIDLALAYLPYGKLDKEYPSDTKFYIFLKEIKIGEGKIE